MIIQVKKFSYKLALPGTIQVRSNCHSTKGQRWVGHYHPRIARHHPLSCWEEIQRTCTITIPAALNLRKRITHCVQKRLLGYLRRATGLPIKVFFIPLDQIFLGRGNETSLFNFITKWGILRNLVPRLSPTIPSNS